MQVWNTIRVQMMTLYFWVNYPSSITSVHYIFLNNSLPPVLLYIMAFEKHLLGWTKPVTFNTQICLDKTNGAVAVLFQLCLGSLSLSLSLQ